MLESSKYEKVKRSNIVKCAQNKYFSYKITLLGRDFSKALVICPGFCYCFFIIILNSIYQPCLPSWNLPKWTFSHFYRINIWKFGISMVNIKQVVWELIKYPTFLTYVTWAKKQHTIRSKTKCSDIYSSIQTKNVTKVENIKKRSCRDIFRTLPNTYNGLFLHHRCLQDSKIYLKSINTKMLEKTTHFFNAYLAEDIPTSQRISCVGISQDLRNGSSYIYH